MDDYHYWSEEVFMKKNTAKLVQQPLEVGGES
jgi:hypothetical protein